MKLLLLFLLCLPSISFAEDILNSAGSPVVVSRPPKKSWWENLTGKKVLPHVQFIPEDKVQEAMVIHLSSTTFRELLLLTRTQDGTILSTDPQITDIVVEPYPQLTGKQWGFRLAYLFYPQLSNNVASGSPALQISRYRFWKFYPDLSFSYDYLGSGISYRYGQGIFSNTCMGAGYGYHFKTSARRPYISLSVQF